MKHWQLGQDITPIVHFFGHQVSLLADNKKDVDSQEKNICPTSWTYYVVWIWVSEKFKTQITVASQKVGNDFLFDKYIDQDVPWISFSVTLTYFSIGGQWQWMTMIIFYLAITHKLKL